MSLVRVFCSVCVFFFKQKTAYEMRISDWSSDVCSSDLASGATALTGVEAIADGVQAFRRPQARNAAATLAIMGTISITMFLGITYLARALGVRVRDRQSVV